MAQSNFPTADQIAFAMVEACKITGEDPVRFVERSPNYHARHFALHAILAVFPAINSHSLADALGCPGDKKFFPRSSAWWVRGQNPQKSKGPEPWWSEPKLAELIAACRHRFDIAESEQSPSTFSTVQPGFVESTRKVERRKESISLAPIEKGGVCISFDPCRVTYDSHCLDLSEREARFLSAVLPGIGIGFISTTRIIEIMGLHPMWGAGIIADVFEGLERSIKSVGLVLRKVPKMGYSIDRA